MQHNDNARAPFGAAEETDNLYAKRSAGDAGFFLRPLGIWSLSELYGRASLLHTNGMEDATRQVRFGLRMVADDSDRTYLRIVQPWAQIEPLLKPTWLGLGYGVPRLAAKILEIYDPSLCSAGQHGIALSEDGARIMRWNGSMVTVRSVHLGKGLVDMLPHLAERFGWAKADLAGEPMDPPLVRKQAPAMGAGMSA